MMIADDWRREVAKKQEAEKAEEEEEKRGRRRGGEDRRGERIAIEDCLWSPVGTEVALVRACITKSFWTEGADVIERIGEGLEEMI